MEKIYLIDGSSFLYRFFFAIKDLTFEGFPTNAIFGFARMLIKIEKENPHYICIIFDTKAEVWRKSILESYKQNRPKMPDNLSVQVHPIKKLIDKFGIKTLQQDGFEADDIIASLTEKFGETFEIVIITSDKDLFQLVGNNVCVYDPMKDITYDRETVFKKFGVYPEQISDYLALVGDTSDNIPGIKSIGDKTARKLLKNFKNIENIMDNLDKLDNKIKKALTSDGNIFKYKNLTKLKTNIDINISIQDIKKQKMDIDGCKDLFVKYGFFSLTDEISHKTKTNMLPIVSFQDFIKKNVQESICICEENGKIFAATSQFKCYLDKNNFKYIQENLQNINTYDIKNILSYDFPVKKLLFDTKLACYLICSNSEGDIDKLFYYVDKKFFSYIHTIDDFGKKCISSLNTIKDYIKQNKLEFLLEIETRLSIVLFGMEHAGIKMDIEYLYSLKNELENKKLQLEKSIYTLSNETFNINSTKELQKVLFDKLKIKPIKKIKTGFSTDFDSLLKLQNKHEVIKHIIDYRTVTKILSTYILPFLNKVDKNNRIHTTFNQTLTSTGRLSSSNPNLQNLPASDDEWHAGIRKSIIAQDGYKLICADYSQIEFRVLCELSEDNTLFSIFENDLDIHTQTAIKVFNIIPSLMDHNQRRMAKIINFGILYGMGYVALAKTLNISTQKAKKFIENYFDRFKSVREFIHKTIAFVEQYGYTETYFHRRRYFENIKSSNGRIAESEKRAALNMCIQGTAADIIKIAMVKLHEKLKSINAHIVLQIHDELIIEAQDNIIEKAIDITQKTMEKAVNFRTPLKVNIKAANNWFDAK